MTTIGQSKTTYEFGTGRGLKTLRNTAHGYNATVKKASFTEATHYPDGYVPEMTALVPDAADPGFWKPADGASGTTHVVMFTTSNTVVADHDGNIAFGCMRGIDIIEGALPFALAADDKTAAAADGCKFF